MAEALLEAGADPRLASNEGVTPLVCASPAVAPLLLDAMDAAPQPGDVELLRRAAAHQARRWRPEAFAFLAQALARRAGPAAVAAELSGEGLSALLWGQEHSLRSRAAAACVNAWLADVASRPQQEAALAARQAALACERAAVRDLVREAATATQRAVQLQGEQGEPAAAAAAPAPRRSARLAAQVAR